MALVYSSDHGRMCPDCGKPSAKCRCQGRSAERKSAPRKQGGAARTAPPRDGVVRVGRESKGRRGQGVTVVHGLPLVGAELQSLAKELKTACGAGGTLKEGVVEVQGDHRDRLVAELEKRGFRVKRMGG